MGSASQTVFVSCLLEVLVASVLINACTVPLLFGEKVDTFDNLKRRKLVGFVVKIVVRISCALQIMFLIAPYLSFETGLFASYNVKAANARMVRDKKLTTCQDAGLTIRSTSDMRAWTFARDDMMAVMVWELAFIPELPWDAWMHHLFVILGVALGSDPQLLGANSEAQPLIDGVAFFLVLGAALAAGVEFCVLMYHYTAPRAKVQATWMTVSIVVQATLVIVLFIGLPVVMVALHVKELKKVLVIGMLMLILLLSAVEGKMMLVKRKIVLNARKKAARQSQVDTVPVALQGSFDHDCAQIQEESGQERQSERFSVQLMPA